MREHTMEQEERVQAVKQEYAQGSKKFECVHCTAYWSRKRQCIQWSRSTRRGARNMSMYSIMEQEEKVKAVEQYIERMCSGTGQEITCRKRESA